MWDLVVTVFVTVYLLIGLVNFVVASIAMIYDPEVSTLERKKKIFIVIGVTLSGFLLEVILCFQDILLYFGYKLEIKELPVAKGGLVIREDSSSRERVFPD